MGFLGLPATPLGRMGAVPPPPNVPSAWASASRLTAATLPATDIYLCDPYGHVLVAVNRFESVMWSQRLNAIGEFELILPVGFNERLIRDASLIDVWDTADPGRSPDRFTGLILNIEEAYVAQGVKYLKLAGKDVTHILTTRVNIESQERTDYPDNLMRLLVDRNVGAGAGLTRSYYSQLRFTVEGNQSWGRPVTLSASRGQDLYSVAGGIAKRAAEDAILPTRLYHGVIATGFNPLSLQYRIRRSLWGVDRTLTGGGAPCVLRPGRGLKDVRVIRDASNEANTIMIESSGSSTFLTEADSIASARATSGVGMRRETSYKSGQDATTAAIGARTQLRSRKRIYRVQATVTQEPGAMFGIDYRLGDEVTLWVDFATDARIDSVVRSIAAGERRVDVKYEV